MFDDDDQYEDERYAGGYYNSGDWGHGNRGWDDPSPNDQYYDDPYYQRGPSQADEALARGIGKVLLVLIGLVCLPVLLVGGIFYCLFRFLRFRPRFIAFIGLISTIIGWLMISKGGLFAGLMAAFSGKGLNFAAWKASFPVIFKAFIDVSIPLSMMVGPWIGLALVLTQCMKMRNSPWLVENEGLSPKWMYGFTFRQSPFEVLKTRLEVKKIRNDTLKPYGKSTLMPLGIEEEPLNKDSDPLKNRKNQLICRAEDEVPKHTLVTGAAGAGKTDTLKSMMLRDMDRRTTFFAIDCKKDPEVAEFLSREARKRGLRFWHFSADLPYRIQGNPEGPSSYDPLAHASTTKKVDMMINTRTWDDAAAVYREQAESYLSKVFALMDEANKLGVLDRVPSIDHRNGELWTFTQLLDKNNFNAVVAAMNDIPEATYVRQQASLLNQLLVPKAGRTPEGQAAQHAQQEYSSKLTGLMVQSYGRWLKGGEGQGSGRIIDIQKLSSEPGNVVLFSLDASNPQDQGALIGSMICADLANMTETRKNEGSTNPVSIYIDEFQSLPPECVRSMIEKARSAGVGLTLAFQSLDQVSSMTGNDRYVRSLLDTCSNFIFHAGSNYDTGLMAAKIIGSHYKNQYMMNRRNETRLGAFNWLNNRDLQVGTNQREEWIVDPSAFAKLSMPNRQNGWKSEAIVIKKASSDPIDRNAIGAVAHKVRMIVPDDVLQEYFDPRSKPIDISLPLKVRVSRTMLKDAEQASRSLVSGATGYPAELEDDDYEDESSLPAPEPAMAAPHDYEDDVPETAPTPRRLYRQRSRRRRPSEASLRMTAINDDGLDDIDVDDIRPSRKRKPESSGTRKPVRTRTAKPKPKSGRGRVSFDDF